MTFDPKTCTKEPLTDKFRPIHIPANATFLDEFYIGSSAMSDGGVLVEQWVGNTTEPAGKPSTARQDSNTVCPPQVSMRSL